MNHGKEIHEMQKLMTVVEQSISVQVADYTQIKEQYKANKEEAQNQVKAFIDELHGRDVVRTEKHQLLCAKQVNLMKQQEQIATKLIEAEEAGDENKVTRLEIQLNELSTQQVSVEARLRVYEGKRSTMALASERNKFNQLIKQYKDVTDTDVTVAYKELDQQIEELIKQLTKAKAELVSAGPSTAYLPKDIIENLIPSTGLYDLILKMPWKQFVSQYPVLKNRGISNLFGLWLSSKKDISFEEYVEKSIEEMQQAQAKEDQQKVDERRNRENRNAATMAHIDSQLGMREI